MSEEVVEGAIVHIKEETGDLARTDILDAFAAFLRLDVAQGDASPETVRS